MNWWLSNANGSTDAVKGNSSMEDAVRQSVMLTSVQSLVAWGRRNSMWPFHFRPVVLLCGNGHEL